MDNQESTPHFHNWYYSPGDVSCENCNCGAILVSQQEHDRRKEEWVQYYKACQTTRAHAVLEEMKQAIRPGYGKDAHEEIKKVREKIATLTHKEKNDFGDVILVPNETEMEQFRPSFPGPDGSKKYIIKDTA